MKVLLPSVYWPNLLYMQQLCRAQTVVIEAEEYLVKQSLRTRCEILSANGPLRLSIPLKRCPSKTAMKDVQIDYASKWPMEHWRGICSAYNKSPFFEYYRDELEEFYRQRWPGLLTYNTAQLGFLLAALRIKTTLQFSTVYETVPQDMLDLRTLAKPKSGIKTTEAEILKKPYYQTFGNKFGFVPNLSVIDLLFNTGPAAASFLT